MSNAKWMTGAAIAVAAWGSMAQAQTTLSLWYHGAGNEVEAKIINQIVSDFNGSQADWKVELQSFPQAAYNDSVVAGALAGNLPDIMDVDGPVMPNWAWSNYLQPLKIDESKIACKVETGRALAIAGLHPAEVVGGNRGHALFAQSQIAKS